MRKPRRRNPHRQRAFNNVPVVFLTPFVFRVMPLAGSRHTGIWPSIRTRMNWPLRRSRPFSGSVRRGCGRLCGGLADQAGQPLCGGAVVIGVEINADELASKLAGGDKGGTGPAERIEDNGAGAGKSGNQGFERLHRLLRRMQAVAGIMPVQHVGRRSAWEGGKALGQQIGGFMLIPQVTGLGRIALAEDDMPGNAEACLAPRGHEHIGLVPAVEADTQAVGLQDAVDLREGGFEPCVIVIVDDASAGAVAVADQIGRIGQHEINARSRQVGHDIDAVAAGDAVEHLGEEAVHCCLHGAFNLASTSGDRFIGAASLSMSPVTMIWSRSLRLMVSYMTRRAPTTYAASVPESV